jgi:hypothetical protein
MAFSFPGEHVVDCKKVSVNFQAHNQGSKGGRPGLPSWPCYGRGGGGEGGGELKLPGIFAA